MSIPLSKQEWDHDNHPYSFDNPNIYMRPATEDDVDNMYSWEMESIDKSLQEDPKVQQLIRDDCYQSIKDTQMIMDQDKTIGMFTACMIDNGEWRYIGEIYLIPEYRGQHIGSTILKNEIANYDRIRLQVAYDNENALRLYKSLGFKIVKENKEAKLYIMEYDNTKALQEAMSGVNASPVDDNFFIEAVLKAKEKEKLKDSAYGIPELRKYPLTDKNGDYDENHIHMAIKFFGKAPKKYKLSLAKRILRAAHSIDLDTKDWVTINDYIKNHKESTVTEGFVDKNIKYTLAGIKIPKLGPVDEKYLMDHKSDYAQLKKSGYIDLHYNNFQSLFNDQTDELYEPLDNLFQHIGYAKDFNIYNKYRLLLCKLFDLPTNHVIGLEGFYPGNLGQLRLKEEEDSSGTPLKPNDVLYHTSKHKGITELQPSFVSRKTKTIRRMPGQNLLSIEALYTTPRVYVGLNTPVSRLGGHGSVSISDDTRIYKIIGFKGSVKEDKELHGAARFIETKSPVKVVDVTDEYLSKHIKTVTNVQNPTGKEVKKPINESYTERKNFIMKEQITKILEAYNSGVLTQEEASTKIEAIQEASSGEPDTYLQNWEAKAIKRLVTKWDESLYKETLKKLNDAAKEAKNTNAKYHYSRVIDYLETVKDAVEGKTDKIDNDSLRSEEDKKRDKKLLSDKRNNNLKKILSLVDEQLGTKSISESEVYDYSKNESYIMSDLRVKQDKIMESFKMGIINATEGMRLIERVMMEADYITEEEDTAYEGDDDNEPEDITPEDTDGDTVDSDDANIDALADYINSLSDDEKTALMSKLSGSDEPTNDDANGNEEVPTDDTAAEGEPTTEETVDPASVSDASLNDANASLDDMEV